MVSSWLFGFSISLVCMGLLVCVVLKGRLSRVRCLCGSLVGCS